MKLVKFGNKRVEQIDDKEFLKSIKESIRDIMKLNINELTIFQIVFHHNFNQFFEFCFRFPS